MATLARDRGATIAWFLLSTVAADRPPPSPPPPPLDWPSIRCAPGLSWNGYNNRCEIECDLAAKGNGRRMDATEAPLEICDREDVQVLDDVRAMRSYLAEHPELAVRLLKFVSAEEEEPRKRLEQYFGLPAFA